MGIDGDWELTICPQMRVQHATFEDGMGWDGHRTILDHPIPNPIAAIPFHDVVIWDCVTMAHFSQRIKLNLRFGCLNSNWWVWWFYKCLKNVLAFEWEKSSLNLRALLFYITEGVLNFGSTFCRQSSAATTNYRKFFFFFFLSSS